MYIYLQAFVSILVSSVFFTFFFSINKSSASTRIHTDTQRTPTADPSSIFHLPSSIFHLPGLTISNLALDQKQMCWWIILLAIIAPTLSHKSPVVIIPGLGGSTLEAKLQNRPAQRDCTTESEYYTIWASIVQGTTRYACFRNNIQLYLNQSTPSGLSNFTGVQIRPRDFGGTGGIEYSNAGTIDEPKIAYMHALVKSLVARGYKRSISIRAATNDFRSVGLRATNEYEYARLKWLIEDTQNLNNGSKVHLLSHSQGGPLTNLFLTTYVSSSWKAQYIASHIMLSAPLLGSSVSIYAAISGPSYDWIPQFLPNMVVPLIRTFVSILWMWPKVGKQDVWGNETVFVQTPLKNYTLKNLDELTHDIPNASILFDKWDEVQNATAHSADDPHVKVLCIFANDTKTKLSISTASNFASKGKTLQNTWGDGTVNLRSLKACSCWNDVEVREIQFGGSLSAHTEIAQDKNVIEMVLDWLDA